MTATNKYDTLLLLLPLPLQHSQQKHRILHILLQPYLFKHLQSGEHSQLLQLSYEQQLCVVSFVSI